uniref:Dolichol kinase n=2 Tax=Lotharella globosa TaxID=91324 RepID=A0A7S3ZB44_9EUKA
MSRTGDPFELCMGPLMFTIVMCVVGLYLFGRSEGAMVMAIVGWGDGFAPVIGERYGKTRYIVRGGRYKSVEGSVACFLFSLLGMKVFNFFLGYPYYNFGVWTLLALVGTAVEAISPSDWDNILIPLAVYHAAPFAQQASRLMML